MDAEDEFLEEDKYFHLLFGIVEKDFTPWFDIDE